MITIKFNILSNDVDYIAKKQSNYSYAFRKLYNNINMIEGIRKHIIKRYELSSWEFNCLLEDVTTKFKQIKTQKNKCESDIVSISNELASLNSKLTKSTYDIRQIFKLNKKLKYKNNLLSKDIVFGGKKQLRRIGFLSNDKSKNIDLISEIKKAYHNQRLLPINYIGSANDPNSNRYFHFDFINNEIIYKPKKGIKISLKYKIANKYKSYLLKLHQLKDEKVLPISVKLSTSHIFITFDEEKLNGYDFKLRDYSKALKLIPKKEKEARKQCFIRFKQEQEARKLEGKIPSRYCGIDLNPEYIGISIIEKNNNEIKIIDKFCYQLTDLIKKSNEASTTQYSKFLNNKRKYEIGKLYCDLFKIINHYKCAYFVMEDLTFKAKNINNDPVEFNRKTKNVWNLNYQQNVINKHCNINGIQLIKINPIYTSFIGNLNYDYFDPTNASIEIARRGIDKYKKGNSIFPIFTNTIIDAMSKRFDSLRDVQYLKDCKNWKQLYAIFNKTEIKYRRQLNQVDFNCFSKDNIKSRVNLITFG